VWQSFSSFLKSRICKTHEASVIDKIIPDNTPTSEKILWFRRAAKIAAL
jgi:hypothetical protein